ncbi:nuclear transport factor 2 family protein [Rhizobium sp. ZW T2_16]|uniref:nuclear transport factor 2 family protein n=1 Tax=Rhizobium sp. ZW T2_16 TaxID=3378083 RepID=UPI003855461C
MDDGPILKSTQVAAQIRSDAIDFVNRINFYFDRWELAKLLNAFADDVVVDHPLGRSVGKHELEHFLQAYEPITLGVRRHNCNHVVDVLDSGDVQVTYYILLIRVAPSSEANALKSAPMEIMEFDQHFPKLISYAMVTDTLVRLPSGHFAVKHKRVENVSEDKVHHF